MRRPTNGLAAFVALSLLVPLSVAGVAVWRASSQSPLESGRAPRPTIVEVESATRTGSANVAIAVRSADAFSPRVQASGLLTSVTLGVGDEIADGLSVAEVAGAELVAYQAEEPLWTDAAAGANRALISVAQAMLQRQGHYAGPIDGTWGPATRKAVVVFNAGHGYGRDNPVLSPASLVWLGPDPLRVASLDLRAGDAVAPGDALFTTDAGILGIVVTEPPGLLSGEDYILEFAGVSAPYTVGSGLMADSETAAAMAREFGTRTEAAGTLRLAEQTAVGTVPSSAIVTDASGVMCIFPGVTGKPHVVEPLSGTLGAVDLDPSLIGAPVLVNPRQVREDLACE